MSIVGKQVWASEVAALTAKQSGVVPIPELTVRFKSRGNSGQEWTAIFRLGSEQENALEALKVAWTNYAQIVSSSAPTQEGQS